MALEVEQVLSLLSLAAGRPHWLSKLELRIRSESLVVQGAALIVKEPLGFNVGLVPLDVGERLMKGRLIECDVVLRPIKEVELLL